MPWQEKSQLLLAFNASRATLGVTASRWTATRIPGRKSWLTSAALLQLSWSSDPTPSFGRLGLRALSAFASLATALVTYIVAK